MKSLPPEKLLETLPGPAGKVEVNGFVFSLRELDNAATQMRRRDEANLAAKVDFDLARYRRNGGSMAA